MVKFAIFDPKSGKEIPITGEKAGWSKNETVAKANEIALKEGKTLEVRQYAIVHTASPKPTFDFEI